MQCQIYYPNGIGKSNEHNKNINSLDGTKLQDVKRSVGLFVKESGGACSCNLLNTTNQNGLEYVSTAAHCVTNLQIGDIVKGYFSFDFEMPNEIERGSNRDAGISRIYEVQYKVLFKNKYTDLALLELLDYDEALLDNPYAAGWDNTISNQIWSNISHPISDHKKAFINPLASSIKFKLSFNLKEAEYNSGMFHEFGDIWNTNRSRPQQGSSGSGYFSKSNLLKAVNSKDIFLGSRASSISNNWYGINNEKYFAKYLDANNTWLNSIQGGYLNDLRSVSDENFKLGILGGKTVSTPSINPNNPTELSEDVLWVQPSIIFALNLLRAEIEIPYIIPVAYPHWASILGINADNFNNSNLILSVYHLSKDRETGLYTERLLYGVSANQNSQAIEPTEFGFKGTGWNCNNPPDGFPLCRRIPIRNYLFYTEGQSDDVKTEYLNATFSGGDEKEIKRMSSTKIPIKVTLTNTGDAPIFINAISYPGDVPKNALQLFNPEEVASRFKSYKYKPSFGRDAHDLYIRAIKVKLEQYVLNSEGLCVSLDKRTLQEITTGNNGGYLNLVNPNFQIDDVVASENDTRCPKNQLILTINTPTNTNKHYGAWLDYFKDRKGNGNINPQDDYTYNFVDDDAQHLDEKLGLGSLSTELITIIHDVPRENELPFNASNEIKTKLRIAIAEQPHLTNINLTQDGIYHKGEVEDYLVKIRPTSNKDRQEAILRTYIPIILMEEAKEEDVCSNGGAFMGDGVDETEPEQNLPIYGATVCGDVLDFDSNNIGKNAIIFNGNMYMGVAEGGTLVHSPSSKKTISIDFLKEVTTIDQDEILFEEGGAGQSGFFIRLYLGKIEYGVQIGDQLVRIESTSTLRPTKCIM